MRRRELPRRMSLRQALVVANELGCRVSPVRRTGEVRVIAPTGSSVRHNGRRKDASRALVALLQRSSGSQARSVRNPGDPTRFAATTRMGRRTIRQNG